MPVTQINLEQFLTMFKHLPVLDVRSPGEYAHAHIPGAVSFPLFTNDERKIIGTAYKQESREKAVKIGLESFGKNLLNMVETAEKIIPSKGEVIVHCWRGGMRSAAVAWLLDLYGFKVYQLTGGYKVYRKWSLQQFDKTYPISIIGGYTGSNKTGILQALKKYGEYTIDLEAIAGHNGSAFGNLDRVPQPSQEHFENLLALALHNFSLQSNNKTIWMEYESQRIGQVNIPIGFYHYFTSLPYYFVNVPFEERLKHIVEGYGQSSKETLINAIVRITKRLGGLEAKTAIGFLMDDDISGCFAVLLKYYDKLYHKNEAKRQQEKKEIIHIDTDTTSATVNLEKILAHARK